MKTCDSFEFRFVRRLEFCTCQKSNYRATCSQHCEIVEAVTPGGRILGQETGYCHSHQLT